MILFVVLGQKRTPCFEVRITPAPEETWPPIYNIVWRKKGGGCVDVVAGYFLVACADQGNSEYVTVRDVSGEQRVDAQPVSELAIRGACEQVAVGS